MALGPSRPRARGCGRGFAARRVRHRDCDPGHATLVAVRARPPRARPGARRGADVAAHAVRRTDEPSVRRRCGRRLGGRRGAAALDRSDGARRHRVRGGSGVLGRRRGRTPARRPRPRARAPAWRRAARAAGGARLSPAPRAAQPPRPRDAAAAPAGAGRADATRAGSARGGRTRTVVAGDRCAGGHRRLHRRDAHPCGDDQARCTYPAPRRAPRGHSPTGARRHAPATARRGGDDHRSRARTWHLAQHRDAPPLSRPSSRSAASRGSKPTARPRTSRLTRTRARARRRCTPCRGGVERGR